MIFPTRQMMMMIYMYAHGALEPTGTLSKHTNTNMNANKIENGEMGNGNDILNNIDALINITNMDS